ncbi:hypothetical protein ACFQ6C_18445 [Streptomyces sp. NPDC056454]
MIEPASASASGTAPAADHAPADSRDMYAVHAMLRRELAELPEYV